MKLLMMSLLCVSLAVHAADGNCWVVGVALNIDNPKVTDAWDDYAVQFAKVFSDNAGTLFNKVQTRTVVGRQVTRKNVLDAMTWLGQNAQPKDLAAFYITCHGETAPGKGWCVGTVDEKEITGKDLKSIAANMRCPVLFVIDTCGAGGFAKTHKDDVPLPPNCAALCGCRAKKHTTNTLNIALHEGLWGRADTDKDGYVELSELTNYVRARVKELHEAKGEKVEKGEKKGEDDLPLIARGENMPASLKLLKTSDKLMAMACDGEWYLGRVTKEMGDKCKVHVMGWSEDPKSDYFNFNEIEKNKIFKAGPDDPLPVKVNDKGEKRLALLVGKEGEKLKVQYLDEMNKKKKTEVLVEKTQVEYQFVEDPNEHEKRKKKKG